MHNFPNNSPQWSEFSSVGRFGNIQGIVTRTSCSRAQRKWNWKIIRQVEADDHSASISRKNNIVGKNQELIDESWIFSGIMNRGPLHDEMFHIHGKALIKSNLTLLYLIGNLKDLVKKIRKNLFSGWRNWKK